MSEDLLRRVASELNNVSGAAERTVRAAVLVGENNALIAAKAFDNMPFDSSPYAYQAWLAAMDEN